MTQLVKLIQNDQVREALNSVLEILAKNGSKKINLYSLLIALSKLVTTSLTSKKPCISESNDIYSLADLLCKERATWELDINGSLYCTLYITMYLLQQSEAVLSKRLSKYLLLDDRAVGSSELAKCQETLSKVITRIAFYFQSPVLYSSPDVSVVSWFDFLLELNEKINYKCTSSFFAMCQSIERKAQSKDNYSEIMNSILLKFSAHLRVLLCSDHHWTLNKEDIITFTSNLFEMFCFLSNGKSYGLEEGTLCDYLNSMKEIVTIYSIENMSADDIEMLKIVFDLLSSRSDKVKFGDNFNHFYSILLRVGNYSVLLNPLIFNCVSALRSEMCECLAQEIGRVVKLVNRLFRLTKYKWEAVAYRKQVHTDLLHGFTAAVYFLYTLQLDANSYKQVYPTVRHFFHLFHSIVLKLSKSSFLLGVNYCINIIHIYRKMELYSELATLARDFLKQIVALDQELLPGESMKARLNRFLSDLVVGYGEIKRGSDAQLALLALAATHPQFLDIIFMSWADLTLNYSPNGKKHVCSYEVLTYSKDSLEESWKPCKVENIDRVACLLEEIRAYSRHRELKVEAVISIYRTAVKHVKDELILAHILCAVVDSISSDDYLPSLANLHISLENVAKRLIGKLDQNGEKKNAFQKNCILGDIFYHQARCDISKLRKKAEEDIVIPSKDDVPILVGDSNAITPYTCLNLGEQIKIAEKMTKALHFWKAAFQLVSEGEVQYFSLQYYKGLALLFRMYGYKDHEIETWKLIYSVSKKFSLSKHLVQAVGELLAITYQVTPAWISHAESLLEKDESLKKSYVYPLFYVHKAKNCYFNQKFEEARELLDRFDEELLKKYFYVNVEHKQVQFLVRRDTSCSPLDRDKAYIQTIRILENLLYVSKVSSWETFVVKCVAQWLLLEVSMLLGITSAKSLRHAKAYNKKHLLLAQRLALPFRVCESLVKLCAADIFTGNTLEANQKLYGLDTILELDPLDIVDKDDEDFIFFGSGSKIMKKPEYLSHEPECSCIFCCSIDFQIMIVDTLTLKAACSWANRDANLTELVISIVKDAIEFTSKKKLKADLFQLKSFSEANERFYRLLVSVSVSSGRMEKALEMSRAAQAFSTGSTSNWFPLDSFQDVALMMSTWDPPSPPRYSAKIYKEERSEEGARTPVALSKTANHLTTLVKAATSAVSSKVKVSPIGRQRRKLIFGDPETDAEGKFKLSDKENMSSPDTSNFESAFSPVAHPLPGIRKNLLNEIMNSCQTPKGSVDVVTPLALSTTARQTRRKAQTERKTVKPVSVKDLFATPHPSKPKPPEIKIFCDDEDEGKLKTRGRKKALTTKKTAATKHTKTKPVAKVERARKLLFDSDSEEERKGEREKEERKAKRDRQEERKGERDRQEEERKTERDREEERKTERERRETSSPEVSILDETDPRGERRRALPLTPLSLADSMGLLSLSSKRPPVLSTRRMVRHNNPPSSATTP